jgi:TonB family protein
MLQPDARLQQRYRIVRQLKQGGMGTVYEALDERLDVPVALKECHFEAESLRKQFEREARLLARLRHPAMTKVIDHFTEGTGQFLVMEFIPGPDLSEMIQARKVPFPQAETLAWADQLLDTLDYLHTQQPPVIHRDIKPQNLKLTTRGQIILLDFGLAKGYVGNISRITTSGSIFGYTATYAPLEQIQGAGTDARSDLYSLAATLYHLLTLTPPADALTRVAEVTNERPDPLLPVSDINPAVTGPVSEVIRLAMSQNRERRPRNASEMCTLLRQAADRRTTPVSVNVSESVRPRAPSPDLPLPDATPKPPDARPRPNARESYAEETMTAAAAPRENHRPDGGRLGDAPGFSTFLMSGSGRGVRLWWIALPMLLLLACGSFLFYMSQRGAGSEVSNIAYTPANTNQPMTGSGSIPTPTINSRVAVSATQAQMTPTATPAPTQRPDAKPNGSMSPAPGGSVLVNANIAEPPPAPKPTPGERKVIVSGGVLNGRAISKPQPVYPPIAKAARASGTVTVQILVDESGRVVSASAVSGHPLLQFAAVAAARQARFSPTFIAGQPVKVSGVITYNFVLQ